MREDNLGRHVSGDTTREKTLIELVYPLVQDSWTERDYLPKALIILPGIISDKKEGSDKIAGIWQDSRILGVSEEDGVPQEHPLAPSTISPIDPGFLAQFVLIDCQATLSACHHWPTIGPPYKAPITTGSRFACFLISPYLLLPSIVEKPSIRFSD